MKYLIIQQQWIRNSTQNGERLIDTSTRRKEANGLARHYFKSNLEMLIKHYIDFDEYEIDEQDHSIALADEESICYYSRFYVREIDENSD